MSSPLERDGIAIVGIGCRLPGGANSPAAFWQMLCDGVDAITEMPKERFDLGLFDPDPTTPGRIYVKQGGFVDDIAGFDAGFFGISPREASVIDPQQRLLLQTAYEAIEDAGIPLDRLAGSATGVFVGISTQDYGNMQMYPENRASIGVHTNTGTTTSIAANRLSYAFDLRGPSMAVDTACSSSLTAAHLACRSLESGECDMALLGGAQLLLTLEPTIGFCKASMLAVDGRCRAFAADAKGYVRSEGVGVVVLKPLARAIADGDAIYAVIAGTAVNQDGHTTGITVPRREAQAAMLRAALAKAGLPGSDVDYVEAHGTGTPVGDPIEATAIGEVVGRPGQTPCVIGSVKTNIGHLEAAAGIAGLIKATLAVAHRQIPPSLHFTAPNPAIDFPALGLRVATALEPWPRAEAPAVAGVNSFGFGGANAHVVLREAPSVVSHATSPAARVQLLPLSARSEQALLAAARSHADFLAEHPKQALSDICGSAALRRTHHPYRAAVIAGSHDAAVDGLESVAAAEQRADVVVGRASSGSPPRMAFVFTGMGPQWWGMGRQLLTEEPVFRSAIDDCDAALSPLTGWSVRAALEADEPISRMGEADVAQVCNFALQTALAALWRSWGIMPDAIIGHSAGGIAAAHTAGVYDLANAALLAHHRSRLQNRTAGSGTMLAVGLSVGEIERLIDGNEHLVSLAAVNSPSACTLSGDGETLEQIAGELQQRGLFARMIPVSVPYHSVKMDAIRDELLESLAPLAPRPAAISLVSDVTGSWADGLEYDAAHWWRNVRQPVRFADGIRTLIEDGFRIFIEIGPHPVLATSISECLAASGEKGTILSSLRRQDDDRKIMLRALAALWVQGHEAEWAAVQPDFRRYVKLPSYSWQSERYWFESNATPREARAAFFAEKDQVHPLLGRPLALPTPAWQATLGPTVMSWLEDHVVQGAVVYPGAAYVEMTLAAAALQAPERIAGARNIEFARALFLRPGTLTTLQTALDPDGRFTVHGLADAGDGTWTLHARARFEPAPPPAPDAIDIAAIKVRCPREVSHTAFYTALTERGFAYGPNFTGLERLWQGHKEGFGRVDAAALGLDVAAYRVHPAFLDAAFQVLIAAASAEATVSERRQLFLPVHIDAVTLYRTPPATVWAHARVLRYEPTMFIGEVDILDDAGAVCMTIRGLRCRPIEAAADARHVFAGCLYEYGWEPAPPIDEAMTETKPTSASDLALIATEVAAGAAERAEATGWARYYDEVEPRLTALAVQFAADAMRALDWPVVGVVLSESELLSRLRVAPAMTPLARSLLALLADAGFVAQHEQGWQIAHALPEESPTNLAERFCADAPLYKTEISLMRLCGESLPGLLRGETSAASVLFGAEGSSLIARFYREVPGSLFYGQLLAETVARLVDKHDSARPVRILEVGGGTGGSTAHLLTALPKERYEYVFTDVSPRFITEAAREFGATAGFQVKLFDAESDPAPQGFALGSFDVVIAANVVHGTRELKRTLANLRMLLAPRGDLVLLELTRRRRWIDIILGITDGWWKFRDNDLRTDHPLLSRQQWMSLLRSNGFDQVQTVADDETEPGQSVILARSDATAEPRTQRDAPRSWLIFGDREGAGSHLAALLLARGDTVRRGSDVSSGAVGQTVGAFDGAALTGCIVMAGHDTLSTEALTADALLTAQQQVCELPLAILAALRRRHLAAPPQLWIVTAGAQSIVGTEQNLAAAPVWGLARVMMREQTEISCRLVDIDGSDEALAAFARELHADAAEEEVALRGAERFVHRLERSAPKTAGELPLRQPRPDENWQIAVERPGALSTVAARLALRAAPGPGEVEIAVEAAGLNFRDVMLAAAMIPPVAAELDIADQGLGIDCVGRIVRCGSDVTEFAPGEEVIAIAPHAFAAFTTVPAALVARKPASLPSDVAASIPCTYVTAHYALERLARLSRGERVLIHAATGGVGLAAIEIARERGAEIFATAGSEEKRAYLTELGVKHVMDSRSLDFAEAVLAATGGEGVDVVLNSLAGEAIAKGIEILKPYGRFVEIGKADIYGDKRLGLLPFRKNLSFFAVDLDLLRNERPALAGEMLREMVGRFADGRCQPVPLHRFPMSDAAEAMRFMAQAKHIGKIILEGGDDRVEIASPPTPIRNDGTYLVTGGLSGFGLATVEWLAANGAGAIVVIGRGEPRMEARARLDELAASGVRVEIARGDVARFADVQRVVQQIRATMPPLRGIAHCAVVYDDAPLEEMTRDRLQRAFAPKLAGSWNLHCATLDGDLDFFVLYSSMAAVLSNAKQANYCAANEFLDALARYRRARGKPALTVHWGILRDVGHVAEDSALGEYLSRHGYGSFASGDALSVLGELVGQDRAAVCVARIDWRRLGEYSPVIAGSSSFRNITPSEADEGAVPAEGKSAQRAIAEIADPAERLAAIERFLREKIATVMGFRADRVDLDVPLTDLGLDSIIAVEFVATLNVELDFELPVVLVLQGLGIRALAQMIAAKLGEVGVVSASAVVAEPPTTGPVVASAKRVANGYDEPNEPPRGNGYDHATGIVATSASRPAASLIAANGHAGDRDKADGRFDGVDYAALDYQNWSASQRAARWLARISSALGARVTVDGTENLPTRGPFILAANHLSYFDLPLLMMVTQRPTIVMAADWLRGIGPLRWVLGGVGKAIFVKPGEDNLDALDAALTVLRAGGILGISPEGGISKTASLRAANTGVAYLATRSGVPVVPVAVWGQEQLVRSISRLRRPQIHISIGEPINLAAGKASPPELLQQTTAIMQALAVLLPPAYRGVYQ